MLQNWNQRRVNYKFGQSFNRSSPFPAYISRRQRRQAPKWSKVASRHVDKNPLNFGRDSIFEEKMLQASKTIQELQGKRQRDDVSDSTTEDPEEASENKRRRTELA